MSHANHSSFRGPAHPFLSGLLGLVAACGVSGTMMLDAEHQRKAAETAAHRETIEVRIAATNDAISQLVNTREQLVYDMEKHGNKPCAKLHDDIESYNAFCKKLREWIQENLDVQRADSQIYPLPDLIPLPPDDNPETAEPPALSFA